MAAIMACMGRVDSQAVCFWRVRLAAQGSDEAMQAGCHVRKECLTQEDAGPVREPEWQEVRAPAQRQLAQQQRLSKLQGRAAAAAAASNGECSSLGSLTRLDTAICTLVRPCYSSDSTQIPPLALIYSEEGTALLLQVFAPGSWRRQSCFLPSARAPSQQVPHALSAQGPAGRPTQQRACLPARAQQLHPGAPPPMPSQPWGHLQALPDKRP